MIPFAFFIAQTGADFQWKSSPSYARMIEVTQKLPGALKGGEIDAVWAADGASFTYDDQGKFFRFDLASMRATPIPSSEALTTPSPERRTRRGPERGRQAKIAFSADGQWKAECRDRNVWVGPSNGELKEITTEGSVPARIKCGEASWVYGEELGQREAMWWSPSGRYLAYYRFDESKVPDYYVTLNEGAIHNQLNIEAYPKPGDPNPVAKILVYDRERGETREVDSSFSAGGDADLSQYVFGVRWSDDGKELWFFRMNRRQDELELDAANPGTGKCRLILREKNPNGWIEEAGGRLWTRPNGSFLLKDGSFLWLSSQTGFANLSRFGTSGSYLGPVTRNAFDLSRILRVDEDHGYVWYLARDGQNPYLNQLHRAKLDGSEDRRLTDPALDHQVSISPTGQYFVDTAQSFEAFPESRLVSSEGTVLATLAKCDHSGFDALGLVKTERLKFLAADGKTEMYGHLVFPSHFDPARKYPLLVDVYGGPGSGQSAERFLTERAFQELGFLVAWFDGRGTAGRGRAFGESGYLNLGGEEIDDQAAGVRSLLNRPYIDASRVGIDGTSYGGYATLMALLRYPEVFRAGAASSPVVDWRNYDSIYTERYMRTPAENPKGYDAGSASLLASKLQGALLLYYGTADNNVHPSNALQLIRALNSAGKHYEVSVGTDAGHSQVPFDQLIEFFYRTLKP